MRLIGRPNDSLDSCCGSCYYYRYSLFVFDMNTLNREDVVAIFDQVLVCWPQTTQPNLEDLKTGTLRGIDENHLKPLTSMFVTISLGITSSLQHFKLEEKLLKSTIDTDKQLAEELLELSDEISAYTEYVDDHNDAKDWDKVWNAVDHMLDALSRGYFRCEILWPSTYFLLMYLSQQTRRRMNVSA